jgi:hypothetical protein
MIIIIIIKGTQPVRGCSEKQSIVDDVSTYVTSESDVPALSSSEALRVSKMSPMSASSDTAKQYIINQITNSWHS